MRAEEATKRERERERRRDRTGWEVGYRRCGGATANADRSSGDEVVTVRRYGGKVEEENEERRWRGGGENLR